jgi:GxxExxY protein
LEIELALRKLPFQSKAELKVAYKDQLLATVYRPDLVVFSEIVAELKAVTALTSEHEAQLFNYMRISKKKVGYLINFGASSVLDWKRFIL